MAQPPADGLRKPESCSCWSEYHLSAKAGEAPDPSSSIAHGFSVMLIPELVSKEECASLLAAGLVAAEAEAVNNSDARLRLALVSFQPEVQQAAQVIIQRALRLIEDRLPDLASSLFGQTTELASMELLFADREPAINIYSVGGEFLPHRDKHSISVLVPLSQPEVFTGGGTAFWPEEMVAGRRIKRGYEEPPHLLRPQAGTAMLFCGELMHAAMPVTAGTRAVLVASLTPAAFRYGIRR